MTKSTFSHHLRILREAGVLTKRIQGTKGFTRLRKDDLDRRFPGLIDAIIDAENQSPSSERSRDSASSVTPS
jgi:DNA-binding transcriptional ArsR family regulator